MNQKTQVSTAWRMVCAATLVGVTCLHDKSIAQSSGSHTISPLRIQIDDWVYVATLNDENVIDGFVAIDLDEDGASEIDHVWIELHESGYEKSYIEGVNPGEAIDVIKRMLGISGNQDGLWPVPVHSSFSPMDFNEDGEVNGLDLSLILGAWGTDDATADIDGDGMVGGSDLALLLGSWGASDPPAEPLWAEVENDLFDSECSEEMILGGMSVVIMATTSLDEIDPNVLNLDYMLNMCSPDGSLDSDTRPTIEITNIGDSQRYSPHGFTYFRTGDTPLFIATAHDEEDGVIAADISWNHEEYMPGTPIADSGSHHISAKATDSDGNTTIVDANYFAFTHDYVTARPVIYFLETEDVDVDGTSVSAKVRLAPEEFDAAEINCASLHLIVEYEDHTGQEQEVMFRVTGMYSDGSAVPNGESAVTNLVDGVLEVAFEGHVPSRTIQRYRISGIDMSHPRASFFFDDDCAVMLEQTDGGDDGDGGEDGGGDPGEDESDGIQGSFGNVSCQAVWRPRRRLNGEFWRWDNNSVPPDSGHVDDASTCWDSTWKLKNLAFGVSSLTAEAEVISRRDLITKFHQNRWGEMFEATTPCEIPSDCPCEWRVAVTAQADVRAELRYRMETVFMEWPASIWDLDDLGQHILPGGAKAGALIAAQWDIIGGDQTRFESATAGLSVTNDVNFSVSVSGGGVGGGASVTIQALAQVGPIESPMVIDDELVAPYVKGKSLKYRFEGWNGVDATANGACFGLTLSEWTARGWITGFGASAKPRIIIPQIPECDVPGAGPDNWE